ncbi:hypothetical protein R1sor_007100 [Riccia sorocarpa]|uniref:HECT-type E3 ubiquitin transferase n=1 Tax=Riccia sorocarpa TaxID=122646 RepID=A0ABD3HSX7_9MARC
MFFSGDPASRKKVDLGGRSSKERDREKLLEQARLEREQRKRIRLQNQRATQIQKCFRGRKVVAALRPEIRAEFCSKFGEYGENADSQVFKPSSKYFSQLFFFFNEKDSGDCQRLVQACRLLQQSVRETSDVISLFKENGDIDWPIVKYRMKHLARLCLQTLHVHRATLKSELLQPVQALNLYTNTAAVLLNTVLSLTEDALPWSGVVLDYLLQSNLFSLLRGILLLVDTGEKPTEMSCIESTVVVLASRYMRRSGSETVKLTAGSFATEVLSIPLVWKQFPALKQECIKGKIWERSIHQLAGSVAELPYLLPPETSPRFPSSVCLLGNILEFGAEAMREKNTSLELATDFCIVARYLMERLPAGFFKSVIPIGGSEDEMDIDDGGEVAAPEPRLEQQLKNAENHDLLRTLVAVTCSGSAASSTEAPSPSEAAAVGAVCAFLYATFTVSPAISILTVLAYRAELVPRLWQYIKRCHLAHSWPSLELVGDSTESQLPADQLGWMLPLAVICPVFSFLLTSTDNEEFYDQQKPLSHQDLVQLVTVLKEALWQLLWVMSAKPPANPSPQKLGQPEQKIFIAKAVRDRVADVSANLLAELHDRNSRRQFTPPQQFHAREAVDENFFAQAESENTRAQYLLRKAPFLVPFTDRVRIYTSQLTAARQQSSHQTPFSRMRLRIRRDRIIEDAFAQLNPLTEDVLKGTIRVTFVNELGVEEAGVDGGGIFKDFMENITKAAFDVQYGLFKETSDHLLYPNPASHMVHDDHLHYFDFLGKTLGKAMFEGILVDIPFATFFLSKLRNKHNFLHDLPSLDPELYRSLLFLKHYDGDLSQLGLYFVIENNEYGEQMEIELLPGGKDIPVTNANKINYIHLVANHRLNVQIRQQSNYFLRGFQQLIKTEWINMFNEQELQILISGSQEGMDVNDLRLNAHYAGGYSEDHPVIEMFWDVVKTLDLDLQQKFLKFVTGCSRGPLLGFKYLEPRFCIQRAAPDDASEETLDRLPTSATCMNLLKLPPYKSKEVIQEKLLYAITAGAGFDLS